MDNVTTEDQKSKAGECDQCGLWDSKLIDGVGDCCRNKNAVVAMPSPFWIETSSGLRVDFINPDPSQIEINDIAWALCRQARFVGHTNHVPMLSVALHSIWVCKYLQEKTGDPLIAMHGLMHDAHEAYTGDIPSPLKNLPAIRSHIKEVEERLQDAIYKALGLPKVSDEVQAMIKEADAQALSVEAYAFLESKGEDWPLQAITPFTKSIGVLYPKRKQPEIYYDYFYETYHLLKRDIQRAKDPKTVSTKIVKPQLTVVD